MDKQLFPKWANTIRPVVLVVLLATGGYLTALIYFGFSPKTLNAGYSPVQPVPFSHAVHAGKLGLDCRYCHNTVERAAKAAIPPTETCLNCHNMVFKDSEKLAPVRESATTGNPIPWIRVHNLPDYAYFNHSAHVTRGVGCVACHGRIDQMEQVRQEKPLSMGWCLNCHRNPAPNLRDPKLMTKMGPLPEDGPILKGDKFMHKNGINPSTSCSTCHR